MSLEALYVVQFGDVTATGLRNGGVVILDSGRMLGGDSGYYYVGKYAIDGAAITAEIDVVKHDPLWINAFGDSARELKIRLTGAVTGKTIAGYIERVDKPEIRLPVKLTWTAPLP
jgi:hypothetical protein